MIHSSSNWLNFIYERLHQFLLNESVIYADEIVLEVLNDPKAFLNGFSRHLKTDRYNVYNAVKNITEVDCMSHARLKFNDFLKPLPDAFRQYLSEINTLPKSKFCKVVKYAVKQ